MPSYWDQLSANEEELPSALQRVLGSTGVNLRPGKPFLGAQSLPAIASVAANSPNTIEVADPKRFTAGGPQILAHEATHVWQNNLPPTIQKQMPADRAGNPYELPSPEDLQAMRAKGVRLASLPHEQAATIVQYYTSQGGAKAPQHVQDTYGPWVQDMNSTPLSTVMPTDPGQKGINTELRPPMAQPETYQATQTFESGEVPDGELDLAPYLRPRAKETEANDVSHLGTITAYDHESGLPIVRRNAGKASDATAESASSGPQVSKPAAQAATKTAKEPALKSENANVQAETPGSKDPASGRTVTQPTDNPAANQALATDDMPEYRKGLESAIKGIAGAKLAATRAAKNPKRLAEKINGEGQPPETVSDYGAAQISVDSPAALKSVLTAVKAQFPVVKEDDNFKDGDKQYGYRNYSLQLQMPNGSSQELQIVPKEVLDANANEHGDYKAAREADLAGNTAESATASTAAKAKNDAAMAKFDARNAGTPKYKFGSTQADIPRGSAAASAIERIQKSIPNEDLAGDGKNIDEPHVTLRYGIQGEDTSGIRNYLASQSPFQARMGKTDVFPPSENSDGAAVVHARVEAPELSRLNTELAKHGDFKKADFDYSPHATIAYVKPEAADRYRGLPLTGGKTFPVTHIAISNRDGNKEQVELKGNAAPTLAKNSVVKLPDGTMGKILYIDPQMNVARVRRNDDGKSVTVPKSKLTAADNAVLVREHIRTLKGTRNG